MLVEVGDVGVFGGGDYDGDFVGVFSADGGGFFFAFGEGFFLFVVEGFALGHFCLVLWFRF